MTFEKFVYVCVTPGNFFPRVIQTYKYLKTSQGYIFHILQHFANKLCSSTNFKIQI